jgi:uncharacterized lipoprotein YajG
MFSSNIKENKMNKFLAILFALISALSTFGCAEQSHSPYNSPDQQRAHSDKAQGELNK